MIHYFTIRTIAQKIGGAGATCPALAAFGSRGVASALYEQGGYSMGAVLLAWRSQGIGRQLWQQAGWQALPIGPITDSTPGAAFLKQQGAQAQQRYQLYASDW